METANQLKQRSRRMDFVTRLVDGMLLATNATCPGLLQIHWDDCNDDCTRYWVHFKCIDLAGVQKPRSLEMRNSIQAVKTCLRHAAGVAKQASVGLMVSLQDRPQPKLGVCGVFKKDRRNVRGYKTYTWVYVFSFYGSNF